MGRPGELALIDQIRRRNVPLHPRAGSNIVLGIGDDCALLHPPPGHEIAITTDMLLEGRHFRRDWHPPDSAGHRALARGLSDLAAMGAKPLAAFLSLALPPAMLSDRAGRAWVNGFLNGLHRAGERYGVALAGGDTAASPSGRIFADIVLAGSVPRGKALRRSHARPGDLLYVTGALGGAAAELAALASAPHPRRRRYAETPGAHPQLYPEPRLAVGLALVRRGIATVAIDLSDGLSSDLAHICRASRVGAEIDDSALPLHPLALAAGSSEHALDLALNGGEDYELLFAVRPSAKVPRRIAGVPVTRIGRITEESPRSRNQVFRIDPAGRRRVLHPGGWEHLTSRSLE